MKKITYIIGSILLCFGIISFAQAEEAQEGKCETSPFVQEELTKMDQKLSELQGKISSECPTDGNEASKLKSGLQQSYLKVLGFSVDYGSFTCGFKKILGSEDNHALANDMKLFTDKLDRFDALIKQAANSCDGDTQKEIEAAKQLYYEGEDVTSGNPNKGYRSLCKAEQQESYYYQPTKSKDGKSMVGYYTKDSSKACSEKEYKFSDLKNIVERLKQTWKNFKEAEKKIQPRDEKTVFNEFLAQQGLPTPDKAQEQKSGCGGKTYNNETKTFSENMTSCPSRTYIANEDKPKTFGQMIQELVDKGMKQINQEYLIASVQQNRVVNEKLTDHEKRKDQYKSYFNRVAQSTDQQLLATLVETMKLIKGEKMLCGRVKESANQLAKFCETVRQNPPGTCDNEQAKDVSCK